MFFFSAIPAISLGLTILGEIFAYVYVLLRFVGFCFVLFFFLNSKNGGVPFRLRGWCMRGALRLSAETVFFFSGLSTRV